MMKFIILALMSLWVAACSAHDENYYRANPLALQQALDKCPAAHGKMSCEELKNLALKINEYAYQLRMDPQVFGQQILALQERLAQQEMTLKQKRNQPEFESEIRNNKQELNERLAVVKWLMSPGS